MVFRKQAIRIKRAKGPKKDNLYLSVFGVEREEVMKTIILSLPPRSYTLRPRGLGDSLMETVSLVAGVFAEIDVNEKLLCGLSVEYPDRIKVSFTLGLDEVTILPPPRKIIRKKQ